MRLVRGIQAVALILALASTGSVLAADEDAKVVRFGVAPGPYKELIEKGIKPGLEKKGYKVSFVEFQDYVQPDLALGNKEIEANLFQHQLYLDKFSKDHNLSLSSIINVPTAELGLYSKKVKKLSELKKDDEVTLSSDPTNLARGLRFLQKQGLITLKADVDPTKATEKDIAQNPQGLRFTLVDAPQIPRTLDSAAAAVINGNWAIAAGIKLSDAIALEKLDENIKNVIAVRTEDVDKPFAKDIVAIVKSAAFHKVVADPKNPFSSFQEPEWYAKQWDKK
jgi:D-methionine transport system substrate-binding protein